MEWLFGDEDVWLVKLEYGLKRAITFNPSVGSHSIFYRVSKGYCPWGSYGMALGDEVVSAVELEYGFNRVITFDPTVESCSNFYRGF
jgi:hypothetical protein